MIKEDKNSFYYDFRIDLLKLVDSMTDKEFLDLLLSANPRIKVLKICYDLDKNKLVIFSKYNNFFPICLSDTNYYSIKHLYKVSGYDCAPVLFENYKKLLYKKIDQISSYLMSENSLSYIEDLIRSNYLTINFLEYYDLIGFLSESAWNSLDNGMINDNRSFIYLISALSKYKNPYDLMMIIDYNLNIVSYKLDIELFLDTISDTIILSSLKFKTEYRNSGIFRSKTYYERFIDEIYASNYIREYYDDDLNKLNYFVNKLELKLKKTK